MNLILAVGALRDRRGADLYAMVVASPALWIMTFVRQNYAVNVLADYFCAVVRSPFSTARSLICSANSLFKNPGNSRGKSLLLNRTSALSMAAASHQV